MLFSAPGKLLLMGEWAVLDVGNPAIVAAVDKRVFAEIKPSSTINVSVKDFGIDSAIFNPRTADWEDISETQANKLKFVKEAIVLVKNYFEDIPPFSLATWGDSVNLNVDGVNKKVGFGSSAASTVAVVSALLGFLGKDICTVENKLLIYKLAALSHYFAQGKLGSSFDVAASTFGGIIHYERFDPTWVIQQIDEGKSIKEIVDSHWPGLHISPLPVPKQLNLLVGWTKSSASTTALIKQMNVWAEKSKSIQKEIYSQIAKTVKTALVAWNSNRYETLLELVRQNRYLLSELTQKSGIPIETGLLSRLADVAEIYGAAGKLSGAGGGGCMFAISSPNKVNRIADAITSAGGRALIADIGVPGVNIV